MTEPNADDTAVYSFVMPIKEVSEVLGGGVYVTGWIAEGECWTGREVTLVKGDDEVWRGPVGGVRVLSAPKPPGRAASGDRVGVFLEELTLKDVQPRMLLVGVSAATGVLPARRLDRAAPHPRRAPIRSTPAEEDGAGAAVAEETENGAQTATEALARRLGAQTPENLFAEPPPRRCPVCGVFTGGGGMLTMLAGAIGVRCRICGAHGCANCCHFHDENGRPSQQVMSETRTHRVVRVNAPWVHNKCCDCGFEPSWLSKLFR